MRRAISSTLRIDGRPLGRLRVRRVVEEIATPQRLHEEEPQRRHVEPDGLWLELPRPQEVRLVAAQVRVIETVGSTLEVASEPLHGVEIAANGRRREVPALELLQHDAATMGHKTPPVTRTLPRGSSEPHAQRPPRQRLGPNAAGTFYPRSSQSKYPSRLLRSSPAPHVGRATHRP